MERAEFHKLIKQERYAELIMTEKLLMSYDADGKSAVGKLTEAGKFHLIPETLVTEKLLFQPSCSMLSEPDDVPDEVWTPLDAIVVNRQFHMLPPRFQTLSLLMRPQAGGWNSLQVAAAFGTLDQFPPGFFSLDDLLVAKSDGRNCFHLAAMNKLLDAVPLDCISTEALLVADKEDKTALCYALEEEQAQVMNMPVDERCRPILGDLLDDILALQKQKLTLNNQVEGAEIDLF